MSETEEIKNSEEQTSRKKFLDEHRSVGRKPRRDIFEDYNETNNYELDLPNTQNKLILSLHQKKTDNSAFLLKWSIGKSSMFIDGKISFVVAEAMRFLTADIVPDELKPTSDIKPAGEIQT